MARKPSRKKNGAPLEIAGRYRVVRPLGQGGGGAVYLVQDRLAGERPMALKLVEGLSESAPAVADLKNEFSTLSLLRHPHLAAVYDLGATEREMFFTSEWIDGRNLLQAAQDADLNTAFQLLVQVLRALDFLHQRGVLHLDLKPANILVTAPDRTGELTVKLIDFGIAQWKRRGLAQAGGFSGTPPYAAPECLQEREPSPSADIYSLGMLLHQIFARRFPFASQDPFEILQLQIYKDPERVAGLDPALPDAFADLLRRMVLRKPEERFASVREVLEELNRILGENFSLRGQQAPGRILEESDHLFYPEILEALFAALAAGRSLRLVGPEGAGKTRLLERLKAQLQLQGRRPWYFWDRKAWEEFAAAEAAADRPILLDLEDASSGDAAAPAGRSGASRVWVGRDAEEALPGEDLLRVPPLDEPKVRAFCEAEIQGAPAELAGQLAHSTKDLYPRRFGELLQALREEGALAWEQGGWHWRGSLPVDGEALLKRQSHREAKRKSEVREFLAGSGLSLPAVALEGMLGFETGALRDALAGWIGEGWLSAEPVNGVLCYRAVAPGAERASAGAADPASLAESLNALYDQGKFAAGIAWFEEALQASGGAAVPPPVRLAGARLHVAEGQAERALDLLQSLSFDAADAQGLLFETRARAENLLHRFDRAKADLAECERHYSASQNLRGLARACNLRGLLFRVERRWPEAEENLRLSVQHAVAAGDLYCAGMAQTNLALVFQEQGRVEDAYAGYQEAWDYARREPHPFLLQSLYQKWINLLHHGGKSAEAEAACYEWMKRAIQHSYRDQQAIALNYLSLIAGRQGRPELRVSYLDQAIALLDGKKHPRFRAQFLVNRAYLHWSQGRFLPAQLDAEAALQLGRLWPDDRLLGWLYIILGKVYRDRAQPDLPKSEEFFEKARDNILKNDNRESLWEVEYNRGLLAKAKGEIPKARELLLAAKQAALDYAEKLPEALRASYLRDRKLESVLQELAALEAE
ncbi:MAG: serine/threonine protein kinase [Deltaproteobacteria bacterium]|nr:serine/threonine protein kinase [Deltaproteobacteria bacterium]